VKDSQARVVINLLTKRIEQLSKEIQLLQHPHPKNCKCKYCTGYTPDYMLISFDKSRGYALWWKDGDEK